MKILVISLAGIGDTLFATPLIHELRANFPDAQIDVLVMWAGARDCLEGNPHLNSIFQKNLLKSRKTESLSFLLNLRRAGYDVSINTHPQSRMEYRVVARLVGARQRLSHAYDNPNPLNRFLVTRTIPQDYQVHSIENNLRFLACIGAKPILPQHEYEVPAVAADAAWAEGYLARESLTHRRLLGIHVGSGGTKNLTLRRWPLGHYSELLRRLNRSHPELGVLLFGGPEEEKDHQVLLAASQANWLRCPHTKNLRQASALLRHCEVFLSVDTALMHLAAAMRVPKQIVIETPTWNRPIHPYRPSFILVPNPAVAGRNLHYYRYDGRGIRGSEEELKQCMASVTVEHVYTAITSALAAPELASNDHTTASSRPTP
jgi:ADP-heptose:LPS heptosyltransferase